MPDPAATFDLLADAAGVRYPNPDRDNRGLCPAHGDEHNPALVFRIGDTGNLIAYCHSQHCTIKSLAAAIGVTPAAFFAGGSGFTQTPVVVEWERKPVLDLLKGIPFGYDEETTIECVMRTLDLSLGYSVNAVTSLTKTDFMALGGIWLEPNYRHENHGDWWDIYHQFLSALHEQDRATRIDPAGMTSAVPKGSL